MTEMQQTTQRAIEVRAVLGNQYRAALAMMRQAIENCPDSLWISSEGHRSPYWQIAFHGLFFTHFYLQLSHKHLTRWSKHRGQLQDLDTHSDEPYSKAEMLEYVDLVAEMIDSCLAAMNLESKDCGFPWYAQGKLEHQINNIRHLQHHAAQLSDRLQSATGKGLDWRRFK